MNRLNRRNKYFFTKNVPESTFCPSLSSEFMSVRGSPYVLQRGEVLALFSTRVVYKYRDWTKDVEHTEKNKETEREREKNEFMTLRFCNVTK